MKLAVLIQFHSDPLLVRNRARLVRALDPDLAVYGSYGGPERVYDVAGAGWRALLRPWMDDVFCIRGRTTFWKRFHTDLAVCDWYRGAGQSFDFDAVAILQWDLLTLSPLSDLYAHVPPNTVGVTALAPLDSVARKWPWLRYKGWRSELEALKEHVEKEYGYRGEPYASLGPGTLLPRAFLEHYASLDLPELCHDEVRLPLFAHALGFDVVDNGFHGRWFDSEEERFFNADKAPIRRDTVVSELARADGRRVFHPYHRPFPVRLAVESRTAWRRRLSDPVELAGSAAARAGGFVVRRLRAARRVLRREASVQWPR